MYIDPAPVAGSSLPAKVRIWTPPHCKQFAFAIAVEVLLG